jgi:hypothetical protein
VRLIIFNKRQWRAMRAWLGEPPALQADHFDFLLGRLQIQHDIIDPMFSAFFKDKGKLALATEAQRRGIPMSDEPGRRARRRSLHRTRNVSR